MKERIVIVFIAVALGLVVTTIAFLIYQQARILPGHEIKPQSLLKTTPTPLPDKNYLTVDEPANESIIDKRTIVIKGKTNPENTLIITTNTKDQVVTPTSQGAFSVTTTIDVGVNKIILTSVAPDGTQKQTSRIITFTTEDF